MRRAYRMLATGTVLLTFPEGAASVGAQDAAAGSRRLQVAPFNSIEVRNSGHLVVRPAQTQRVTLLKGSLEYTRVAVTDEGVLVVDRCRVKCPRGYELEIEVLAPSLRRLSLANGGWIQTAGNFAPQTDLAVVVRHGGRIDVRSMAVDRVTATVEQGGRILTVPRGSLFARVAQGGVITYWGNAQVRSSIQHGGVVHEGSAEELSLPLAELGPPLAPDHGPHRSR